MLGDAIRSHVLSALPAIEALGPPGGMVANRLRDLVAREGSISAEEVVAALNELRTRLPDIGDDLRNSLQALSSLLVSLHHDAGDAQARRSTVWGLADMIGKGVAEWVVSPESAAITRRVAAAMVPAAEKLAPFLRDLAKTPADADAPQADDRSSESAPVTAPERAPAADAQADGGGDSDDDEGFDPFEMGTLGSGGPRHE